MERTSTIYRHSIFIVALTVCFVCAAPTPARAAEYEPAIAETRQLLEGRIQQGFPGISAAVGVGGQIVWSEGFGFEDVEKQIAATPDTRFRVGSVSKVLTAAAVGLLVEQGKLDIDAPVQRYVPYFPEKEYPITTRLLTGHSAGIRHYRGLELMSNKPYASVKEALTIFQNDPLLFEPGTKVSYSSYGWNLVSAVIEGASSQEFLGFMDKNVFGPLEMTSTGADLAGSDIPNRTTYYSGIGEKRRVSSPVDLSNKWASGGFLSTANDLVKFGAAHLQPGFLKAETLKLLHTPQVLKTGEVSLYGIGWRIDQPEAGLKHLGIHHSGLSTGGKATVMVYPDSGIVTAVLINCDSYTTNVKDARQIADSFAEAIAASN